MKLAGRKPVMLGLAPEQHDLIRRAALANTQHMTQFVIHSALTAARKVMAQTSHP